jgi:hypothetical protein
VILELLPFGGFFAHFVLAGLNLYPGDDFVLRAVAYFKIEFSPGKESGNQGRNVGDFIP